MMKMGNDTELMRWWDRLNAEQRKSFLIKHGIETSLAFHPYANLPPQGLIWIKGAIEKEGQSRGNSRNVQQKRRYLIYDEVARQYKHIHLSDEGAYVFARRGYSIKLDE